jgi:hypothetical protein
VTGASGKWHILFDPGYAYDGFAVQESEDEALQLAVHKLLN